jgi:hypothetical protein
VERYDEGRESNNAGHSHDIILPTMWGGEVLTHKSCWRVLSDWEQINVSHRDGLNQHSSPRATSVSKSLLIENDRMRRTTLICEIVWDGLAQDNDEAPRYRTFEILRSKANTAAALPCDTASFGEHVLEKTAY